MTDACTVCDGRGWTYLEHPDGSPAEEVPCSFCGGEGDEAWVEEMAKLRAENQMLLTIFARVFTVGYVIALYALRNWPWWSLGSNHVYPVVLYIGLWFAVLPLGLWAFLGRSMPRRAKSQRASRHAPGFTDDREIGAAVLWGTAIAAKGAWDHRERNLNHKLDEINRKLDQ
jgi:hypothetical protein